MAQELVDRQADSGRRQPQRLDTGSNHRNKQRDAEWLSTASTCGWDPESFDTRRR